ncbi:MAG TPA: NAD(P)-dependent oxidoreductase [Solirubrobacterales bacterium]|jgi:nucleoside-diphosphate-sugar epimerase|nr:NAD(P)-dependent oxidoreductase [Solirubrobacterales bacterium]
MKVFVAGAGGVIGRPLVRRLVAAGHEVTGTTRREERAEEIRAAGATAIVCDAFDAAALETAVREAAPEVVVNQLTSLPQRYEPRKASFYEATNRVRREGGHNLIEAARAAGARRLLTQSISFLYAPEGSWVKDEEARPFDDAPGHFGPAVAAMLAHEREAVESHDFDGLVLRYGQFYGPGTYYAPGGHLGREVNRRRFPVVGPGTGTFSFLHVEDAAGATVAALDHGAPGIYNVVDDEPAPLREWLPVYAEALGAKPPRRVPVWLAKLVAGSTVAKTAVELRGASNAKAKRELGWQPGYPSWRQGFREALA